MFLRTAGGRILVVVGTDEKILSCCYIKLYTHSYVRYRTQDVLIRTELHRSCRFVVSGTLGYSLPVPLWIDRATPPNFVNPSHPRIEARDS